jgi:hypothetical protein
MNYLWLVLFLLLPLSALCYCAWHLWQLLPLPALWRAVVISCALTAFALLFVAVGKSLDQLPMWLATCVYEVGCSTLIILLYLFMLFLLMDALVVLHVVPRDVLHHSWTGTLGIMAVMVAVFTYGNIHYRNKVRVPMTLSSGGKVARPYKLVMASDLHLGYHNRRAELAKWIDLINGEHPDALLIAGDIIDRSLRPLVEERMAEEWRRLECPVYACLGNHEYYSGKSGSENFYQQAGITLLRDSVAVIDNGLCIVGRDDRSNLHRLSLHQLMKGKAGNVYTILLDHQPYHLEQAERQKVDFQFSGHTHYGQVWPISWITDMIYECSFGLYQRGNTRYYVSSGLGIWGGKFRVGTRSEYVVVTLMP